MKQFVRLFNRDFFDAHGLPAVIFKPTRYGHHNWGGPRSAEIEVSGDESALWQLRDLLRYGVEIYNEQLETLWWGYVAEVQINIGAYRVGYSLDRMSNRIAVAYELLEPGASSTGTRATTPWGQNDESAAEYGVKETFLTLNSATDAQALATRDTALSVLASPLPIVDQGDSGISSARLICKGWYDTLSWKLYGAGALTVNYTDAGAQAVQTWATSYDNGAEDITYNVGSAATNTIMAQSYQVGASQVMTQTKLRLKLVRVGSPTDNMLIDICEDAAGVPGSIIATATLAASQIAPTHNWIEITFPAAPIILAATTYWFRVRRSGAADGANYYRVIAHSAGGYGPGSPKRWTGSAWVNETGDLYFYITAETRETTFDVGAVTARQEAAQSFQLSGSQSYSIASVKLKLGLAQLPSDSLIVDICTDNGFIIAPDAVLASSDAVPATGLSSTLAWVTFTFALPPTLNPATIYWIRLRRSGSLSVANFYRLATNQALGYADGQALVGSSAAWSSPSPQADVLFEIGGVQETTEQMSNILTAAGQMFTAIEIEQASGIYGNPYRDGDATAQACLEELLQAGTSDGKRLAVRVTRERILQIVTEPELGQDDYYLKRDGRLVTRVGAAIQNEACLTGAWAKLADLDAASADATDSGAFVIYIEQADYAAGTDRIQRKARQTRNAFDLLNLK